MSKRSALFLVLAWLTALLGGCQTLLGIDRDIVPVECSKPEDCAEGMTCSPSHTCVAARVCDAGQVCDAGARVLIDSTTDMSGAASEATVPDAASEATVPDAAS
ncbi:MAG TPA: hypothetical protein VGL13_08840, partial [Polyangiaceae bacterium]